VAAGVARGTSIDRATAKQRTIREENKLSTMSGEFLGVEQALEEHLPPEKLAEVKRILYGIDTP
jgi:hypothetical protein